MRLADGKQSHRIAEIILAAGKIVGRGVDAQIVIQHRLALGTRAASDETSEWHMRDDIAVQIARGVGGLKLHRFT